VLFIEARLLRKAAVADFEDSLAGSIAIMFTRLAEASSFCSAGSALLTMPEDPKRMGF